MPEILQVNSLTKEYKKGIKAADSVSFSYDGREVYRPELGAGQVTSDDARTMRSKKQQGLFICGEAIDLCGECGGYNLHFAFASGIVAGENL